MTEVQAAERLENLAGMSSVDFELADALRLGASALRADEWLDIAGAPKDGTKVDLWHDAYSSRICHAYWCVAGVCWRREDGSQISERAMGFVTHYRPLPSPPKEQSNG